MVDPGNRLGGYASGVRVMVPVAGLTSRMPARRADPRVLSPTSVEVGTDPEVRFWFLAQGHIQRPSESDVAL